MPSELETAARQFRNALLSNERAAASEMVRAYGASWRRIDAELRIVQEQIAAARAAGLVPDTFTPRLPGGPVVPRTPGTFTPSWLYERDRLASLQRQVEAEMRQFSALATELTEAGQLQAVQAGITSSQALLEIATNNTGLAMVLDRLPIEAVQELVGFASDGSPLRALFDALGPDVSRGIRDALSMAVSTGMGPRETARLVRQQYGMGLARALRIARTEQIRAYREATHQNYLRNAELLDGWIWLSAANRRVCPSCWGMHGTRHPLTERLDGHPNCVIDGTIIDSPQILATSKRWFDGQVVEITTVNGNFLTVTKNHPILTDKGWVAAHLLQEGDNVISSLNSQRTVSIVDPNYQRGPSAIEDITEAFARTSGMTAISMPTASIDFHGDGGYGDVNIVGANRFLESWGEALFLQPLLQQPLALGSVRRSSLTTYGAVAEMFPFFRLPFLALMHRGNEPFDFFGSSLARKQLVSFGLPTNGDVVLHQSQSNNIAADAIAGSDLIFRLAVSVTANDFVDWKISNAIAVSGNSLSGEMPIQGSFTDAVSFNNDIGRNAAGVICDSVVKIAIRQFAGHVYNLQTSTGWYVANNIITHNCRCVMVPIVKGRAPTVPTGETLFQELPVADQVAVLGQAGRLAWSEGAVKLPDFVGRKNDPQWGTMRYAKSLRQVLGKEKALEWVRRAREEKLKGG